MTNGQTVSSGFAFYRLSDLTDEEREPPEFIVAGMLPVGLSFLSGAPKIRKSFLALQLAAAVANGAPFLGMPTRQCGVAYFDLEGSKARINYRASRMSLQIPDDVLIANETTRKLANGLVSDLTELHRQRPDIRLFIIDTYSRARGPFKSGGANAYDADVALLEPLQRAAIRENISILCVHHDRKGAGGMMDSFERLSGTMGIAGSADCVLNLISNGKRFDGKATLEYTPRDARGGELQLTFDENTGEWQQSDMPVRNPLQNAVCRFLIENVPPKQREGVFYRYDDVFVAAFNRFSENPGPAIRAAIEPAKQQLFELYQVGVQLGVQSNGKRGIRVFNLG